MAKDLNKAKLIAKVAHWGQKDKGGEDYFTGHLSTVASLVTTEEEKIVAFLHDSIEDTIITKEDLLLNFDESIVEAIVTLTKVTGFTYQEYLAKIKKNDLARKVKIADLTHNSDLSRLKEIKKSDRKRQKKYLKAIEFLKDI